MYSSIKYKSKSSVSTMVLCLLSVNIVQLQSRKMNQKVCVIRKGRTYPFKRKIRLVPFASFIIFSRRNKFLFKFIFLLKDVGYDICTYTCVHKKWRRVKRNYAEGIHSKNS